MEELTGVAIASLLVIGLVVIGGEVYVGRGGGRVLSISETAVVSPSPSLSLLPTDAPQALPGQSPSLRVGDSSRSETGPEASPTLAPAPTPSPKPTVLLPPPTSSQEINGFIDRFAAYYGVNPHVLRHLAICESGFASNARNSAYAGLYQFGPVTWKNNRLKMGEDPNLALRYNAEEATQTAAYMLSLGRIGVWPNCQP